MTKNKIAEVSVYSVSAALCFILAGYSILSWFYINKVYPVFGITLMGGLSVCGYEFIAHILYILQIFITNLSILNRAIYYMSYSLYYSGIYLDFGYILGFGYCVYTYLPWGAGDDAYLFTTIFIIVSTIKACFVYMCTFNVRASTPYFLNFKDEEEDPEEKIDEKVVLKTESPEKK